MSSVELLKLTKAKKPVLKKNYVGVEIEFIIPEAQLNNLNYALVENDLQNKVHLGYDSSINFPNTWIKWRTRNGERYISNPEDKPTGRELRILASEDEMEDIIKTVCSILHDHDAWVNKSCGLHVHLDMRNRSAKDCARKLYYCEDLMYRMNPSHRDDGEYSGRVPQPIRGTYVSKDESLDYNLENTGHYHGINYGDAYEEHSTIEIRIHEGTVNGNDIVNWVHFLLHVINMDMPSTKFKRFKDLGMPNGLLEYARGRARMFVKKA